MRMKRYIGERSEQRPRTKRMGSAGCILLVLLIGLITFGMNGEARAAEKGPIKIGFIAPLTGNWAQTGDGYGDRHQDVFGRSQVYGGWAKDRIDR